MKYFISYWSYGCSRPASTIVETDDLEKTINQIQRGRLYKGVFISHEKLPHGTVLFFHKIGLPDGA